MDFIAQGSRTAESHVVPVISQNLIEFFVRNRPQIGTFAREAGNCVLRTGLARAASRGPSGSRAD
jgi:hypothetical protein